MDQRSREQPVQRRGYDYRATPSFSLTCKQTHCRDKPSLSLPTSVSGYRQAFHRWPRQPEFRAEIVGAFRLARISQKLISSSRYEKLEARIPAILCAIRMDMRWTMFVPCAHDNLDVSDGNNSHTINLTRWVFNGVRIYQSSGKGLGEATHRPASIFFDIVDQCAEADETRMAHCSGLFHRRAGSGIGYFRREGKRLFLAYLGQADALGIGWVIFIMLGLRTDEMLTCEARLVRVPERNSADRSVPVSSI